MSRGRIQLTPSEEEQRAQLVNVAQDWAIRAANAEKVYAELGNPPSYLPELSKIRRIKEQSLMEITKFDLRMVQIRSPHEWNRSGKCILCDVSR